MKAARWRPYLSTSPCVETNTKRALAGEAYDKAKLYVEHYQRDLLDTDFPALKERFPPYTKGEIGFVGMIDLSTRRIGTYGFFAPRRTMPKYA